MGVVIAEEPYADVIDEVKGLFIEHWQELALNQGDIALDPDYSIYEAMANLGALAVYTVRDEGRIVGYAAYIIRNHPHYRNHTWALSDLFWVHPDNRDGKVGNALFAFIEESLRAKGVSVMHTTHKTAHPAPGLLLQRRGHAIIEHGLSKRLN